MVSFPKVLNTLIITLLFVGCDSSYEPLKPIKIKEVKNLGYIGSWPFKEAEGILMCTQSNHIVFITWQGLVYALNNESIEYAKSNGLPWIDTRHMNKASLVDMVRDASRLCSA